MPVPMPPGADRRAIASQVMRAAQTIPFPAFRMIKGTLHAAEVVGTIQVDGIRINVLPKTDSGDEVRDGDFLVNILRAAGYLRRAHTASGAVRSTTRDPLEIIISEAAAELNFALKSGVPRRYQERFEESRTLRGRIDFNRLATRLPSDLTVLPVRHTPLTTQNELARCLYWMVATLAQLTRSSANRQILTILRTRLGEVWEGGHRLAVPVFAKIQLAPSELHWERVLSLAKLLSLGQFIDPTYTGSTNGFTMLFPLQHLFEKATHKVLNETLNGSGINVNNRAQPLFLLQSNIDKIDILRLKPDYLFYRDGQLLAVADAKWKRLSESSRAYGARREDLYQVNAYLDTFATETSVVLMPRAPWMPPNWTSSYTVTHSGKIIHLVAIDIEKLVSHRAEIKNASQNSLRMVIEVIITQANSPSES